ncbi:response regulator [Saccharospirillum impatiens]|uniref:response regulator n=1 Tax=Saccharospirillum impatiens TaxID=169438 RepID=UPI0004053CA9|nr:response regulator [Saccharospirillum impatiens]
MNSKPWPVFVVVDDDPEDFLLVKTAVQRVKLPLQVVRFSSGDELMRGLPDLVANLDPLAPRVLILLDLNMPGKDGRACLKEIKSDARWSDVPIIIFSTSSSPEDINRCYEQKANSYISKPENMTQLEDIVKTLYQYWFVDHAGFPTKGLL